MLILIPVVPRATSGWYFVIPLAIAGSGLGMLVSQLNNYTLSPISEERVSEAAGVNSAAGSFGLSFGLAFAGAIFIESVFQLPGVGQLLFRALAGLDLPMIMGIVFLVSVAVVVMNMIVDILYCLIDPRISLRGGSSQEASAPLRRGRRFPQVTESATEV